MSWSHHGRGADSLRPLYEEEARERQLAQLKQNQDTVPEKIPEREKGDSRDKAAEAVGTNGKYVDYARQLREEAPEEQLRKKCLNRTKPEEQLGKKCPNRTKAGPATTPPRYSSSPLRGRPRGRRVRR